MSANMFHGTVDGKTSVDVCALSYALQICSAEAEAFVDMGALVMLCRFVVQRQKHLWTWALYNALQICSAEAEALFCGLGRFIILCRSVVQRQKHLWTWAL
jgi:hypothetical protein